MAADFTSISRQALESVTNCTVFKYDATRYAFEIFGLFASPFFCEQMRIPDAINGSHTTCTHIDAERLRVFAEMVFHIGYTYPLHDHVELDVAKLQRCVNGICYKIRLADVPVTGGVVHTERKFERHFALRE